MYAQQRSNVLKFRIIVMTKNLHPSLNKKNKADAFTLVEIMFVLVILGVIGVILTSFMTSSARSMLWSVNKSLITSDFRKFTGQITKDAYNASVAYLYSTATPGVDYQTSTQQIDVGLSGDCLFLVQTEPFPNTDSPRYFRRIVAYYRQPILHSDGRVIRNELVFDDATPANLASNVDRDADFFEDFVNANLDSFAGEEVVLESTRGLADGQLFRRLRDGTFLINGEIINGVNSPSVSNTYNLTISTRG